MNPYQQLQTRLVQEVFTLYDKDEASDLTEQERKALKEMLKHELEARQ